MELLERIVMSTILFRSEFAARTIHAAFSRIVTASYDSPVYNLKFARLIRPYQE